jgi:hypothetical protein
MFELHYQWDSYYVELFDACVDEYDAGNKDFPTWFSDEDIEFLDSIGHTQREFFDFVEDNVTSGGDGPTGTTALLVAAVRRDYFRVVQKTIPSTNVVPASSLPPKTAELAGLVWLPRIIAKARAKLKGELDDDTMYCCGGDRAFLTRQNIHPADFLRAVWAAGDDDQKIIDFIKTKS